MKKNKSQVKKARNVNANVKPSKGIGKSSKKKSKIRQKAFCIVGKKDETSKSILIGKTPSDNTEGKKIVPTEVKQVITNLRHPKEKVSSNWEAFKAGGFHKAVIKPKPNASSDFKGTFRKKRKLLLNGGNAITKPTEAVEVSRNPVECLDIEDSYVQNLVPPENKSLKELTKCIAIDCEMVGVGDGKESALARVSLVNQHGVCVYDKFVKTKEDVTDYRTKVSGVRPGDLALGEELETVQMDVAKIVNGRILVGHAISHDLKVLFLSHPPHMIRDTSKFKPFRDIFDGRTPALRKLSDKILGVKIQDGEHSSVEDAKATMQLYNLYQREWEEHRKLKALEKKEKLLKSKGSKKLLKSSNNSSDSEDEPPTVSDAKLSKHKRLNVGRQSKIQAKKPAMPISTMPDEYVAF